MNDNKNPSLRELLALPVQLPLGPGSIEVRPMGWYQAAEAIEHLLPAIDEMPLSFMDGAPVPGEHQEWAAFVLKHRNTVSAFCACASGLPEADIRELQPSLMIELVVGLIDINADFFVRSLPVLTQRVGDRIESMQRAMLKAAEASKSAFSTSSNGSSEQATASATS